MSLLSNVRRGKELRPHKMTVYGVDGIGKSTFAAKYARDEKGGFYPTEATEKVIVLPTEEGVCHMDVPRFDQITSWTSLLDHITELHQQPHDFDTVVLDSIDFAETLLWKEVMDSHGIQNLNDLAWGKAYQDGRQRFRELLDWLDALWYRGMAVTIVGHAGKTTVNDPTAPEPYQSWGVKLQDTRCAERMREWAYAVLFCNYDTTVKKVGEGRDEAKRAVSYGRRLLFTQRKPAFEAKNRYALPESLPLDWWEFEAAYRAFYSA